MTAPRLPAATRHGAVLRGAAAAAILWLADTFASAARAEAFALESLLDASGSVWTSSAETCMARLGPLGFRWLAADKSAARAYRADLTFEGAPVPEALMRTAEGRPARFELALFSRGEQGDLPMAEFQALGTRLREAISARTARKPVTGQTGLNTAGVRSGSDVWIREPHRIELHWSYSTGDRSQGQGQRPEYIRVDLLPFDRSDDPRSRLHAAPAERPDVSETGLRSHIRRADGDVRLDGLPMVDQGDRGYCAVATAERILRYYGGEFDQHALAQLAMSSAEKGTDIGAMMESLSRIGSKLGCKIRTHEEFTIEEFTRLVDRYNREARRADSPPIELGRMIDVSAVYMAMNYDLLKEARLKSPGDRKRFVSTVKEFIDQGIPLAWSTVIGKVPETPPVTGRGGHMRIIHGYSDGRDEVLYTDSWGPGHELKRMSTGDAWAITTGLYTIEPRRIRR